MFETEKDVRRWVRDLELPNFWVEAAAGGTFGFSDCVLGVAGQPLFMELKLGKLHNGIVRFNVRPQQRRFMMNAQRAGFKCALAIGVEKSDTLLLTTVHSRWNLRHIILDRPELPYCTVQIESCTMQKPICTTQGAENRFQVRNFSHFEDSPAVSPSWFPVPLFSLFLLVSKKKKKRVIVREVLEMRKNTNLEP